MQLKQLLKEIDYKLLSGSLDVEVSQIDYDSRQVVNHSLFVCIPGAKVDGHSFIEQVINKGAKVVVVEREVEYQDGVTYIQVKEARLALALLSCAFFDHPSRKMTVIGLTGTKGKTTTSYMVQSILEKAGEKVGIIGTIGSIVNGEIRQTKNTTPESFELQKLMYEMVEGGTQYCVMEVSSQGLMLNRVAGIDFDYGVFTNLSPDHIGENEHRDFEHYMECKKLLFKMCKVGLFNKDDEHFEDMIKDATCQIKTYSIKKDSDLKASHIQLSNGQGTLGVKFDTNGLINATFETDIPGHFSVYNSLVAIMICALNKIQVSYIQEALKQVRVRGRVEIVPVHQEYTVMIDYAHNALSFESLIKTIQAYNPHRIICVYGAGGHRDHKRRYEAGEIVAKYNAFSILTADNPRGESIKDICDMIITGIDKYNGEYVVIEDRKEAIHYALQHAEPKDVILCLGKGHETYQIIDKEPLPFSEREIIEQYFQN
ncbi:MAG: UDP-N-acetylmuramoyl-L-alanyl-D-glutamate--2,6-diaminopimelate ligase [Erysipelotrichales bacterium]|nr:UDP-N-acetylmuramoyl-L-alanyl-D-glutamate--2,6-diaminopimelate ligase [Erysipelotrichales bacterium]